MMARAPRLAGLTLRPYQVDAVERAVVHLGVHERGQLIAPCAAGKSLIALQLAQALAAERLAITVPNLVLVEQWLRTARRAFPGAEITAVCSGADATRFRTRYGVTTTTDIGELRRRFLDASVARKMHIVVSTYHSTPVLAEALAPSRMGSLDLLVADEAHRTAGAGADATFRAVVLPNGTLGAVRATRRLFLTATPRDTPGMHEDRTRSYSVALSAEDATETGVDAVRVQPMFDAVLRATRYRTGPIAGAGAFLPDGSLLAVRALIPRPFVDPEPTHPHEVVRFRVDPMTGQVNPMDAALESSVLAPTLEDAGRLFRALQLACVRGAVPMGAPLLDGVRYYERRSSAPFYMDDRELYGEIVADIPGSVVEDAGFTAPYRVVLLGVRRSEVEAQLTAGGPSLTGVDPESARQMVAAHCALLHGASRYGLHRGMVFNAGIADADAFAALSAWHTGPETAPQVTALHTNLPVARRHEVLARFRDATPGEPPSPSLHVLSVVRMGIEGQDIPAIEHLVFTAPKTSDIDVVQAKGRAVRLDPAMPNKVATVLLPVIVDDRPGAHATSASLRIDSTSRAIATTVLGALAGHDERAFSRLVADGETAVREAPHVVSARHPELLPKDEVARTVRHLAVELHQELAAVSPRRYYGVEYDRAAEGFRAQLAVHVPHALLSSPKTVINAVFPTAREAACAVDRVADAHGLSVDECPRNFGRAFNIFDRQQREMGKGYVALPSGEGYVAYYLARRAGGLALRYAASSEEAQMMREALVARYGDPSRVSADRIRHDLISLRTDGADGAEWDPVARRWWAWVRGPAIGPTATALQVGLGFFRDEHDAERAADVARLALGALPAHARLAGATLLCRQAVAAAALRAEPLEPPPSRDAHDPVPIRVGAVAVPTPATSSGADVAPAVAR